MSKYGKVILLALVCHVLAFGVVVFQIAFTAATFGYGGFVLEVPLNLIPISAVLIWGLVRQSRTMILAFPIYFALWIVPALLYRAAIAPEFNKVAAPTEAKFFEEARPQQLVILAGNGLSYDVRRLLQSDAIEKIVFAIDQYWRDDQLPIYNPETRTLDFSKLNFEVYRKEALSNCSTASIDPYVLLQDFGLPSCIETSEDVNHLPRQIIFSFLENGPITRTHTVSGTITPTDAPNIYKFEELDRYTQKLKYYRVPSLLPTVGWGTLGRPSTELWTLREGPLVTLQAGSNDTLGQDLVLESYEPDMALPKRPDDDSLAFYNRLRNFKASYAKTNPADSLDYLLPGLTSDNLLERINDVNAVLPRHPHYPEIARMYALRGFRTLPEFLCVAGIVNEVTAFMIASYHPNHELSDDCRTNIFSDSNLADAYAMGEEVLRQDEARKVKRTEYAEAFREKIDELRRDSLEMTIDGIEIELKLRRNGHSHELEMRLLGRFLRYDPTSVGMRSSDEGQFTFSKIEFDLESTGRFRVSKYDRRNVATIILSEEDLAQMMRTLDGDKSELFFQSGLDARQVRIGATDAEKLKNFISSYWDALALKQMEDEHGLSYTHW